MRPTFDAYTLDRRTLYLFGRHLVATFARRNAIPLPTFHDPSSEPALLNRLHRTIWRTSGMQWGRTVWVNIDATARPGRGGYTWSFPGYKVDRTAYGVTAHEFGHYVAKVKRLRFGPSFFAAPAVSGYEPNASETIAETFKLFITNSDLLKHGSPVRYAALRDAGLKPVIAIPWREMLEDFSADPRIIAAAERWATSSVHSRRREGGHR